MPFLIILKSNLTAAMIAESGEKWRPLQVLLEAAGVNAVDSVLCSLDLLPWFERCYEQKNHTALMWASHRSDEAAVKRLLEGKADPNHSDESGQFPVPLSTVADITRLLFKAGADLSQANAVRSNPVQLHDL